MEGTVKFFNTAKGFGFIAGEDGKEYFVHATALGEGVRIRDNDNVTFEPGESDRGLKAENVALSSGNSARAREDSSSEGIEELDE